MKFEGTVIKYGDNVDTDVIIPARYLNSSDPAELALHCMEDIDKDFVNKVKKGGKKLSLLSSVYILRNRSFCILLIIVATVDFFSFSI